MKRSVLTLFSACLIIGFTSCKKEVIEIVNQSSEENSGVEVEMVQRSSPVSTPNGGGGDGEIIKGVTDPNEEDDFTKDRKSKITGRK